MMLAGAAWVLIVLALVGMSCELIEAKLPVVCVVSVVIGFAFCTFSMSLTKLVMGTVPDAGKSHFFAMYAVVGSLTLGLFPFLWGTLIDSLDGVEIMRFGLNWNQYSISFSLLIGVLALLFLQVLGLEEEKAANFNQLVRDLIRNNPLRDWLRR